MTMQALAGFAPDADPTIPGIIVDCENMLPSLRGMKAAGLGEDVGLPALAADCLGAATLKQLNNSARTFAGTATKLYEESGGVWVDVSGSVYSGTGEKWRFAQFGDISIATNYANAVQASPSGSFADLAGSPPKAHIVETCSGFVLLFNYNDGVNIFADGWWCSGLYDQTTWTPAASTQAANGRLFDTPGPITAAKRLANTIAVYKDNSIYLGQYVGLPVVWSWTQITAETGAYCQEAVVNVSGVHYFLGRNGIFMFDGSRPVPVGATDVREWLRSRINPSLTANILSGYDTKTSLVYWFYPSVGSTGPCDEAIVFNTITGKFGRMTQSPEAIVDYTRPDKTWLEYGNIGADWLAVGTVQVVWLGAVLQGSGVGLSFIGYDGLLYKFESDAGASSITTGDMGDDTILTTLQRVKPRFMTAPSSATLSNFYKRNEGDALTAGVTVAMSDNKFDVLRSDRWHRVRFDFVGNCEITAYDATLTPNGAR